MSHTSRSHEQIQLRAYRLWEERGRPWGTPDTDWFRAEQELAASQPEGALATMASIAGAVLGTAVAFLTDARRAL